MNLLDNLKKVNPSLKKEEISGILYLIKNISDLDNTSLIQLTGLPKEELKRFKTSMHSLLLDSSSDLIKLNEQGISELALLDLTPYAWTLLSYKNNTPADFGIDIPRELVSIRKKYDLHQKREYDQWFATEESSLNKLNIMRSKGCINDKNILLIGDDDLLSITLGLSKLEFSKISVLDIDSNLLDSIKAISTDYDLKNIFVDTYDVKKDLNIKYFKQNDVVVIDPPYTKTGVTLFLNRAIEALNGSDKYIFLYFGNSFKSPEKFLKIQEVITRAGLVIEDKIDKFSRYNGAESIGSASSVYVLKTTPFTKQVPVFDLDKIYTYESVSEDKFPYVENISIKVSKIPNTLMKSKSTLHSLFNKFCLQHKLKVIDTKIIDTKNGGTTFTFALSNASLIVHAWPELNALYVDLISGNPLYKKNDLYASMCKLFSTSHIIVTDLE